MKPVYPLQTQLIFNHNDTVNVILKHITEETHHKKYDFRRVKGWKMEIN